MVAITVILAAVIASAVLTMGDNNTEATPDVGFSYNIEGDNVSIQHRTGASLEAGDLLLQGGFNETDKTWANISSKHAVDDTVGAGDEIVVTNVTGEIDIIWIDSEGEADSIISTFDGTKGGT